jgi:hypothetical protein
MTKDNALTMLHCAQQQTMLRTPPLADTMTTNAFAVHCPAGSRYIEFIRHASAAVPEAVLHRVGGHLRRLHLHTHP